MTTRTLDIKEVKELRKRWNCASYEVYCAECGTWTDLSRCEFDDGDGYPYWGYPVCRNCGTPVKSIQYLYRDEYAWKKDGYPQSKLILVRRPR